MTPAEKKLCAAGRAYSTASLAAHGIIARARATLTVDDTRKLAAEQRAQRKLGEAAMRLADEDARPKTKRTRRT